MTDLPFSSSAPVNSGQMQGASQTLAMPPDRASQNSTHHSFMDPVVMQLAEKCILSPLCGVPRQSPVKSVDANSTSEKGNMSNNARDPGAHPEQSVGPNSAMLSVLTDTRSMPVPAQNETKATSIANISSQKDASLSNAMSYRDTMPSRQATPSTTRADTLADALAFPSVVTAGMVRPRGGAGGNGSDLYTDPYLQVLSRTDISDPKQRLAYISSVAQNDGAVRDPRKNQKGKKLDTLNQLAAMQTYSTHSTYDVMPSIVKTPLLPIAVTEEA
jgi:hypothetical protein